MRDSQRQKIYDWEKQHLPSVPGMDVLYQHRVGLEAATLLCSEALRLHGTYRQTLRLDPGYGCRHAYAGSTYITLPRWARTGCVIMHELAHVVTAGEGHGKVFCRTYAELLSIARHIVTSEPMSVMPASLITRSMRGDGHLLTATRRTGIVRWPKDRWDATIEHTPKKGYLLRVKIKE